MTTNSNMEMTGNNAVICISWQTEAMPASSHCYFHAQCLLERPEFKSEAIAQGRWREVQSEEMGSNARCEHCERKLQEEE